MIYSFESHEDIHNPLLFFTDVLEFYWVHEDILDQTNHFAIQLMHFVDDSMKYSEFHWSHIEVVIAHVMQFAVNKLLRFLFIIL